MERLSQPRELGRYLLVAKLGRGAMGIVYLGVAPDGSLVALKQVREQFLDDDEFRDRFRREVTSSKKVSSPRTAAVIDADVDADPPWLASEFVYGPTLEAGLAAETKLPTEAVLWLAKDLARALADIHRTGLIHRDLKPSNVILAGDGARVIDFGIARAAETEGGTDITHTSWLLGSPAYMSPEQAESGTLTTASDLFSMATVLYVACTGENPFKAAGSPQTMYKVVNTAPDLDVLPSPVRDIIEPCWAKDPEVRPTADQLLDAIPDGSGRRWPVGLDELAADQRTEIDQAMPDDTVRFHDGGTRIFPDGPAPEEPEAAASPPPPPPPPAPVPPVTPIKRPGVKPESIGWMLVAGIIAVIIIAGLISEANGDSDNASADGDETSTYDDETTDDYDPGDDDDTTTDEYVDDEPSPTQDDIVDAGVGDCVWGSEDVGANWDIESCQDGNFTVLERIEGATSYTDCDDSDENLDYGQHITDFGGGDTDFVLCLSMNWAQGDIGHAPVDTCLSRTGSGTNLHFEFVDCDSANAIVTGRTPTYDDEGFCNQDGWASDRSEEFDLSYTVCWRDY